MSFIQNKIFLALVIAVAAVGCETKRKASSAKKPATTTEQPATTDVPHGRIDDSTDDDRISAGSEKGSNNDANPNSTMPQGSVSPIQMGTDPRDSIVWDGLSDVDQSGKLSIKNVAVSNSP